MQGGSVHEIGHESGREFSREIYREFHHELDDMDRGGVAMKAVGLEPLSLAETPYQLLRLVAAHPELSQRDVARRLGISLGKVNYCLKELAQKGLIKVNNFKNSPNKRAYRYLLTPRGIEEKTRLTVRFLQTKMRQYELLRREIEQMRREAAGHSPK